MIDEVGAWACVWWYCLQVRASLLLLVAFQLHEMEAIKQVWWILRWTDSREGKDVCYIPLTTCKLSKQEQDSFHNIEVGPYIGLFAYKWRGIVLRTYHVLRCLITHHHHKQDERWARLKSMSVRQWNCPRTNQIPVFDVRWIYMTSSSSSPFPWTRTHEARSHKHKMHASSEWNAIKEASESKAFESSAALVRA